MALILEVKGGRLAGKRIAVPDGQKVTIGRAPGRANFAVPHDSFMSSVHFAVECASDGSRIKDRKSSNGTFLNGERITEAALSDGDEIRSGRTVFVVQLAAAVKASPTVPAAEPPAPAEPAKPAPKAAPPAPAPAAPAEPRVTPAETPAAKPPAPAKPAPQAAPAPPPPEPEPPPEPMPAVEPENPPTIPATPPPAAAAPAAPKPVAARVPAGPAVIAVGSWCFTEVPEHWEAQGEFGIQRAEKDSFPSNVVASEEILGLATLQHFVEAQVSMLRQYLRDPRIDAALPPTIPGSDETVALEIRYSTKDEQMILLRRIFARKGKHVGVLTLTTLEKDSGEIGPAFETILAGASFQPKG